MWSADQTSRNLKCPNAVEALGMPEEGGAPGGSQGPSRQPGTRPRSRAQPSLMNQLENAFKKLHSLQTTEGWWYGFREGRQS